MAVPNSDITDTDLGLGGGPGIKPPWVNMFTRNLMRKVELRVGPYMQYLQKGRHVGNHAQVMNIYDPLETSKRTTWSPDTSTEDQTISSVYCRPTTWNSAVLLDRLTKAYTLLDPQASILMAMADAVVKRQTGEILNATMGKRVTDSNNAGERNYAESELGTDHFTGPDSLTKDSVRAAGVTWDLSKFATAVQTMMSNGVNPNTDTIFAFMCADHLFDMLDWDEYKNIDYTDSKPMIKGAFGKLLGVQPVLYPLNPTAGRTKAASLAHTLVRGGEDREDGLRNWKHFTTYTSQGVGTHTKVAEIIFVALNRMYAGTWLDLDITVNTRPDKMNSTQLACEWTQGFVRLTDAAVHILHCTYT